MWYQDYGLDVNIILDTGHVIRSLELKECQVSRFSLKMTTVWISNPQKWVRKFNYDLKF